MHDVDGSKAFDDFDDEVQEEVVHVEVVPLEGIAATAVCFSWFVDVDLRSEPDTLLEYWPPMLFVALGDTEVVEVEA